MAERQTGTVLGHLCRVLGARTADDQTDGQLLERFLDRRGSVAGRLCGVASRRASTLRGLPHP